MKEGHYVLKALLYARISHTDSYCVMVFLMPGFIVVVIFVVVVTNIFMLF